MTARRMPNPLLDIADELVAALGALSFGASVAVVYSPLEYARSSYAAYTSRWGLPPKHTVILGMNPGPWGMGQTGVPFGDVHSVVTWLGIEEPVGRPPRELPSRQVHGFECRRREMSGARVWGWARATFGTPERFFSGWFVANYCPLLFFDASGRSITPDRLPCPVRKALLGPCDHALRRTVEELHCRRVVALGRFAFSRAQEALAQLSCRVVFVPHPSPANPTANTGWDRIMAEVTTEDPPP